MKLPGEHVYLSHFLFINPSSTEELLSLLNYRCRCFRLTCVEVVSSPLSVSCRRQPGLWFSLPPLTLSGFFQAVSHNGRPQRLKKWAEWVQRSACVCVCVCAMRPVVCCDCGVSVFTAASQAVFFTPQRELYFLPPFFILQLPYFIVFLIDALFIVSNLLAEQNGRSGPDIIFVLVSSADISMYLRTKLT